MLKWLEKVINFILPQRCLLCGRIIHSDNSLCPDCFNNVEFITAPYCQKCGKPLNTDKDDVKGLYCTSCLNKKRLFRLCRSAIKYDENSKKLLLDFKFADHVENRTLLARWLSIAGKDIFFKGIDLIIPIPLHYSRLIKRKYNQSAMLAAELSKLINIPANYKVLKKVRYTRPQVECSGKKRRTNVRNAFKVSNPATIKDKHILLIDDVYTTGSTTHECSKVLLAAGAKTIDVLTVARVCL